MFTVWKLNATVETIQVYYCTEDGVRVKKEGLVGVI